MSQPLPREEYVEQAYLFRALAERLDATVPIQDLLAQTREEWRFFPADPDLPSRIVLLDTNGYLTVDVFNWLSSQDIPLIVMNWKGELSTLVGSRLPNPALQYSQLLAEVNGTGLQLSVELIKAKVRGSQATLNRLPITPRVDEAIEALEGHLGELAGDVPDVSWCDCAVAHGRRSEPRRPRCRGAHARGRDQHPDHQVLSRLVEHTAPAGVADAAWRADHASCDPLSAAGHDRRVHAVVPVAASRRHA